LLFMENKIKDKIEIKNPIIWTPPKKIETIEPKN
jgi:hypothetical protein